MNEPTIPAPTKEALPIAEPMNDIPFIQRPSETLDYQPKVSDLPEWAQNRIKSLVRANWALAIFNAILIIYFMSIADYLPHLSIYAHWVKP